LIAPHNLLIFDIFYSNTLKKQVPIITLLQEV